MLTWYFVRPSIGGFLFQATQPEDLYLSDKALTISAQIQSLLLTLYFSTSCYLLKYYLFLATKTHRHKMNWRYHVLFKCASRIQRKLRITSMCKEECGSAEAAIATFGTWKGPTVVLFTYKNVNVWKSFLLTINYILLLFIPYSCRAKMPYFHLRTRKTQRQILY